MYGILSDIVNRDIFHVEKFSYTNFCTKIKLTKVLSIQMIKKIVQLEYNAYRWHTWYVLRMKLWEEVVCHFTLKDEQTVLITFAFND